MLEIKINNESVFKKENKHAKAFKDVKVFAGDPWSMPAYGKIRKLTLENKSNERSKK